MRNTSIRFDDIETIEWYDGVVRGIGRSHSSLYLIVLIEWDTKNSKRRFAIFDLNDSALRQIKDCFESVSEKTKEEKWNDFEAVFSTFIESNKENIQLSLIESKTLIAPNTLEEYEIEVVNSHDFLSNLQNYDIENVMI